MTDVLDVSLVALVQFYEIVQIFPDHLRVLEPKQLLESFVYILEKYQ